MRKIARFLLVAALFALLFTGNSFAKVGLGFYLEAESGSGELEYDDASWDFDVDAKLFGGGFVLDTGIADQRVFNYRLNLGLTALDIEDDFGTTAELRGVTIDNTFGWSIVRNPKFRLWLGPQIRLGIYTGDVEDVEDIDGVTFAMGPVLGANFNVSDRVALAVTGGIRFKGFAGQSEYDDPYGSYSDDLTGTTTSGFINFGVLFGLGR
jgi:hypothetical protein